ncbi:DNA repair protein RecN [candidate division TA06 bacterium]|uniref:DNA repair protein RecN n=1 Tax=candidate division TA06 bacterium TaxID=2250710 RepID=A0A660SGX2_UNCT6|nr:MAG: DNA repair protein RecN [candidate division TA06 bacterium]
MLLELSIKNIAIIDSITIDLRKYFNVMTGETGAGKSIIINSINLLLGERFDRTMLRKGENYSEISGVFTNINNSAKEVLDRNCIEYSDPLIVRRRINGKRNSRSYINDTPVTINILKEIGQYLIDLHGQHEHQSLLFPERQLELIDDYGDYDTLIVQYRGILKDLLSKRHILKGMESELSNLLQNKDIYEYQVKEIEEISPEDNEDKELESKENYIKNRVEIKENIDDILKNIFEEEGAEGKIASSLNYSRKLSKIDEKYDSIKEILEEITYKFENIRDLMHSYYEYNDNEIPPIDEIESRIAGIGRLKKKYGGSIESVNQYYSKLKENLDNLDVSDDDIKKIRDEIKRLEKELHKRGEELHNERRNTFKEIENKIPIILEGLAIKNSKFNIRSSKLENPGINGLYGIEFFISTNPGEDLKPMNKIASGGEISRIMLAFKSLLNRKRLVDTLIFDEIDSGIGGDTAYRVGEIIKEIGKTTQIVVITHLPQVSMFGESHYKIEKKVSSGRTEVGVRLLSDEERIEETARMLGVSHSKESAIEHAKKLLSHK